MTTKMPDEMYIKIINMLIIDMIFLLTSVSPSTIELAALYILKSLLTAVKNNGKFEALYPNIRGGIKISRSNIELQENMNCLLF